MLEANIKDEEVILIHLSYVYMLFWSSFGDRRRQFFALNAGDSGEGGDFNFGDNEAGTGSGNDIIVSGRGEDDTNSGHGGLYYISITTSLPVL